MFRREQEAKNGIYTAAVQREQVVVDPGSSLFQVRLAGEHVKTAIRVAKDQAGISDDQALDVISAAMEDVHRHR